MSAFQGFDKKLNLAENTADRDVLNNLGGAPIADDIVLFMNNLRNISILVVGSEQRQGSFIRFNPLKTAFVFTNNTMITVGNDTFFVGDSNGLNEFRLYTNSALTNLVTNPPLGVYTRSDSVSARDILNLNRPRRPVVENLSLSRSVGDDRVLAQQNRSSNHIFTSFIKSYGRLRSGFFPDLSGYINAIDESLNFYNLRKNTAISNLSDFTGDHPLSLSGVIYISDPSDINRTSVSNTSGPGIFILNPTNNSIARIFSSNVNLWFFDGNHLVTASREISVGGFVFDQQARILRKNNLPEIQIVSHPVLDFTHFVGIVVNGEEYSLCLR